MLRNSRQRNYIKQLLMGRTDHPTATVIYEDVRKEYPSISLGTVYRNLNLMVEIGEIRKVQGLGNADHFDGNIEPHCHHVCIRCGAVNDVELESPEAICRMAQEHTEHRILNRDLTFGGICSSCLQKEALE